MNRIFIYLKNFDWILFFSVALLSCLGLIEIYSIALGQETLDLLNFQKQIIFVCLGIFFLFLFSFIDYNFFKNSNKYLYLIGIASLIAVLFFGTTINGAKSWFNFGNFSLQPVEFIKIILIIFLANFFSSKSIKIRGKKQLIYSGLGTLVFIFLVFMQPDLGSVIILFLVWFSMILVTGFNKKYFISIILMLIILFSGMWAFYLKDYQKERILTFINPDINSLDGGYNVSQAIIAVGSGGLYGRGIGFGSQSQLKFLPEAQNDFIFAVISEELGFFGVLLIFFFFFVLFSRCISITKKINNDFGIFLILGAVGLIFIEMFINISMNVGILPVIGISLPFISYGGSSIISHFLLIGIIQNIIIKSKINY